MIINKTNIVFVLIGLLFISPISIFAEEAKIEIESLKIMDIAPKRENADDQKFNTDLNDDNIIDHNDLRILYNNWGKCGLNAECLGNINSDNEISKEDLRLILKDWSDKVSVLEIERIADKCDTIRDKELQKTCFIRLTQDIETRVKRDRILNTIDNESPLRDDSKKNKREQTLNNYLRYMSNMSNRFLASLGKYDNLTQRIESRISKIEGDNLPVSDIRDNLDLVKSKIETTKTEIEIFSKNYEKILISEADKKELFDNLKEDAKNIHLSLKEIHSDLKNIVTNLKNLFIRNN